MGWSRRIFRAFESGFGGCGGQPRRLSKLDARRTCTFMRLWALRAGSRSLTSQTRSSGRTRRPLRGSGWREGNLEARQYSNLDGRGRSSSIENFWKRSVLNKERSFAPPDSRRRLSPHGSSFKSGCASGVPSVRPTREIPSRPPMAGWIPETKPPERHLNY